MVPIYEQIIDQIKTATIWKKRDLPSLFMEKEPTLQPQIKT